MEGTINFMADNFLCTPVELRPTVKKDPPKGTRTDGTKASTVELTKRSGGKLTEVTLDHNTGDVKKG
jgi:hypothetical protein